jgi:SAM-dependent methyltransferase
MNEEIPWFRKWFNEDYLKLYSYRNIREAELQVNFLIGALKLKGVERILDLGCGTGRHAITFAKKGYNVLGIDISPYLIGEAIKTLQRNPSLPARFQTGDMLLLKDIGLFDVVINMFTSFGYFENNEENEKVLHVVREHLPSGGKFFLDYLHPAQVKKTLVPYLERDINGEKVVIRKVIEGDRVIKTISFPGRAYKEEVILYTRDQIENMLSSNRFHIENVWNDYFGNSWEQEGERQLFYCQAI